MRLKAVWVSIMLTLLVAGGCAAPRASVAAPTKLIVRAGKVAAPPRIDGRADDAAWRSAPPTKIPTAGGPTVTMRAVYTDKELFLTATWPDATRDDIQRVWSYDGAAWQGGSPDDSFSMLWNIDNSIKDFNRSGCDAVCHKPSPDPTTWRMEIVGPAGASLWNGRNQRGDMWDLSLAISNVKGTVSDYFFAIDPAYSSSGGGAVPRIYRQNDVFVEAAPWRQNYLIDPATGSREPAETYRPGLNLDNTPYPTDDQMIPIPAGTVWQAGDRLPYMIFASNDRGWTASKNDLKGKGVWRNGQWTVEVARPLKTGHPDDINFSPIPAESAAATFCVAIFNHTIIGHTGSKPVTLIFGGK